MAKYGYRFIIYHKFNNISLKFSQNEKKIEIQYNYLSKVIFLELHGKSEHDSKI